MVIVPRFFLGPPTTYLRYRVRQHALLAPPPHYVRYMLYRLFLGGQYFVTLRLAQYSKVWFAARYALYQV